MNQDETMHESFVDVRSDQGGLSLHVRDWAGARSPFVLVHGLSSNLRTWDGVARALAAAGHRVVSVDQRGHGLSAKAESGYDFATMSEDLHRLLDLLQLEQPLLAGQSWGGNVMLDFAARYPRRARGFAFVDGGVLDLQTSGPGAWEQVSIELRPPDLAGTPRMALRDMIRTHQPEWSEEGIEATLHNFETLPDGTVRSWLGLERHMKILRALWEQRPADLYARVQDPVLICMADEGEGSVWTVAKHRMVEAALERLPRAQVKWFHATAHDIHVHRPQELAALFLHTLAEGIWARREEA